MNPHNLICESLEFVTLAEHFEKPDVGVISPQDVGWHAVAIRKPPHKVRKDAASDPVRKIQASSFSSKCSISFLRFRFFNGLSSLTSRASRSCLARIS